MPSGPHSSRTLQAWLQGQNLIALHSAQAGPGAVPRPLCLSPGLALAGGPGSLANIFLHVWRMSSERELEPVVFPWWDRKATQSSGTNAQNVRPWSSRVATPRALPNPLPAPSGPPTWAPHSGLAGSKILTGKPRGPRSPFSPWAPFSPFAPSSPASPWRRRRREEVTGGHVLDKPFLHLGVWRRGWAL